MNAAKYNTLRAAILSHMLGVAEYAAPANVKLRLFTAAPTAAGGGTPVSGNGYADVTIPWDGSYFPAAALDGSDTESALSQVINFGIATGGNWGTIVAVDIRDAATNALMWFATLDSSVTVNQNQGFAFNIGDLTFSET